jgi:hypothetical protein
MRRSCVLRYSSVFNLGLCYVAGAAYYPSPHCLTLWACKCLCSTTWDSHSQIWTWPYHPILDMPHRPTLPYHFCSCHPLERPLLLHLATMEVCWAQGTGECPTNHHPPHGTNFAEDLLSHSPGTIHCRKPDMLTYQQTAVVVQLCQFPPRVLVQLQVLTSMFLW